MYPRRFFQIDFGNGNFKISKSYLMYTREGQVSEEIAFRDIKAIIMPKSDQEHVLQ
jgi:hypothetical protein